MLNELLLAFSIILIKFIYTIIIYKTLPNDNWDLANKILFRHTIFKNIILITLGLGTIFYLNIDTYYFFLFFMPLYFISMLIEIVLLKKIRTNKD